MEGATPRGQDHQYATNINHRLALGQIVGGRQEDDSCGDLYGFASLRVYGASNFEGERCTHPSAVAGFGGGPVGNAGKEAILNTMPQEFSQSISPVSTSSGGGIIPG